MKLPELKRQNRRLLFVMLLGLILALVLMSLPLYHFTASVYTKKSGNTVVGDEKYQTVRAEVEALAEDYRAQGFDVEINESVLERVNSKGETTSLVTFSIDQVISRNLFAFLQSALPGGHVFRLMLACAALSVLCAALGCIGEEDVMPRFLSRREAIEDALAGIKPQHSGMIWLLLPVFAMMILCAVQIRHGAVKSTLLKALLYAFVIVMCLVTLYPYYVMLITAFRSNAETLDMYFLHLFPTKWIWSNLSDIVRRGVPRYLLNSVFVAGGATLLAMLCGIPAAYAMARMNFKGKKAFLGFVIMSQMFSPVVLLIGISQLMTTLHLNDSVVGLMLINAAFNQAFAVWLLRGTFISISPEMEQAALIDGCGTVSALIRVLIPMAAPGIVTALIFVFINAWNEYTISTVLISTAANRPITVGITQFSSFNMIEWQYLFAASLLATIPVVLLFMSIEKHLTAGLTSGGVKG